MKAIMSDRVEKALRTSEGRAELRKILTGVNSVVLDGKQLFVKTTTKGVIDMTKQTNWDLLTNAERKKMGEPATIACEFDLIRNTINAMPARLLKPQLPESLELDQWWNSRAADEFRALHPDMDGEQVRPVWEAAVAAATNGTKVGAEPTQAMVKAAADAWLDCDSGLILNKARAAVRAAIQKSKTQESEQ